MSNINTTKVETEEVTTTKNYLVINNEHKFEIPLLLDICKSIHGTDGFMSGITNPSPVEKDIFVGLRELGAIDKDHRGTWFESDEELLEEIYSLALDEFYEEEEEVDTNW